MEGGINNIYLYFVCHWYMPSMLVPALIALCLGRASIIHLMVTYLLVYVYLSSWSL